MPRLDKDGGISGNVGGFGFSGVRPDKLGSTEYTLVELIVDISGSVAHYVSHLEKCLTSVVEACKKSAKVNNLLLRFVTFNHGIYEIHGFTPVMDIDPASYIKLHCTGGTSLIDAIFSSVGASNIYGKLLADQDYAVNAISFVITDGDDNGSTMSMGDVKKQLEEGVNSEYLESSISVLIGINTVNCGTYLKRLATDVGFTQYIDTGDVTPEKLARLASFVSKSISSQSNSLGSGGPSQPLTF